MEGIEGSQNTGGGPLQSTVIIIARSHSIYICGDSPPGRQDHTVVLSGGLTTQGAPRPNSLWGPYRGGRNGVSKGIEDGRRPPTLRADHPLNSRKAVSGVAKLQSVEGYGMAGPNNTLGSPWPPLAIHDTPMGPYYLRPYRPMPILFQ
jgi:hypothetical protein